MATPTEKSAASAPFRATYRIQLRQSFPLDAAAKITSYLDDLGVSHLYLSPLLEARPESNHGYDAIDPLRISDERGGDAGLAKLVAKVEASRNIEGLVLDIVPNHVAANWRNPTWWDVLKLGQDSKFWTFFDFRPRAGGDTRVVLPVLGKTRQAVLAARELHLGLLNHELIFRYWDNYFPIAPKSYPHLLRVLAGRMSADSAKGRGWQKQILKHIGKSESPKAGPQVERAFTAWLKKDAVAERVIALALRALPLKDIEATLDEQNYDLEDWRNGSREVNYRRFFDINDLAAIRIEDEKTFNWAHTKIRELVKKYPMVHGLRVDHVDGLTDPEGYLKKLSGISKNVWVEKILGDGEVVPSRWQTKGTTGYEFLGMSARLFVDLPGLLHLHSYYNMHVDRRWERFRDCVNDSKREMLESHFTSEMNFLTERFFLLASRGRKAPGFTREELRDAIKELTSSLGVYRTYFASGHGSEDPWLKKAFADVEGRGKLHTKSAFNYLRSVLLGRSDSSEQMSAIIKRWEQLTGPVMAKGLEDTALYRYFPLLSLNVVGGELDWVGDGAIEFHAFNQERLRTRPLSMNASSTHDTKRAEDVRARIHVISEVAEEWTANFEKWRSLNTDSRTIEGERTIPDQATECFIYETLAGAWPTDGKITAEFVERMQAYFLKAAREAKSGTSWNEPDANYEKALQRFIASILALEIPTRKTLAFQKQFVGFAEKCAYFGAFNSLSMITLKVLSPGLPDFYQGTELWDLSLVDPDNRRAIDYDLRRGYLKSLKEGLRTHPKKYQSGMLTRWKTGEVKLWLTWELLKIRQNFPDLFIKGEYYAIEPRGQGRRHFLCFLRRHDEGGVTRWALIVVPRFLASQIPFGSRLVQNLEIKDEMILATEFPLLPQAPRKWTSALTGATIESAAPLAGQLLEGLPVAIYTATSDIL